MSETTVAAKPTMTTTKRIARMRAEITSHQDVKAEFDAKDKAFRESIIQRLDPAALVTQNLIRKTKQLKETPFELQWIHIYKNPNVIINDGATLGHFRITLSDQRYPIDKVFISGSTWDIAKFARKLVKRAYIDQQVKEISAKTQELKKLTEAKPKYDPEQDLVDQIAHMRKALDRTRAGKVRTPKPVEPVGSAKAEVKTPNLVAV